MGTRTISRLMKEATRGRSAVTRCIPVVAGVTVAQADETMQ
jgi:hypothetical protein